MVHVGICGQRASAPLRASGQEAFSIHEGDNKKRRRQNKTQTWQTNYEGGSDEKETSNCHTN